MSLIGFKKLLATNFTSTTSVVFSPLLRPQMKARRPVSVSQMSLGVPPVALSLSEDSCALLLHKLSCDISSRTHACTLGTAPVSGEIPTFLFSRIYYPVVPSPQPSPASGVPVYLHLLFPLHLPHLVFENKCF